MGFSDEDQILTQHLYIFKGFGAKELIAEFPNKGWDYGDCIKLLEKLHETAWRL